MKIAIITPTFPPYAGGIGNVAAANARELIKLGHEVRVFTPQYGPVTEEITDVPIQRIKPLLRYGNGALITSFGWMLRGFDILHLHYPFFGGAEMIWLQRSKLSAKGGSASGGKARGSKLIIHYHMDVVGEGISKTVFKLHKKLLLPGIIKMADRVIVTSLDYARQSNIAAAIERQPNRFVEVPNGVDLQSFTPQPKPPALLEKHGIDPEDKVVLFVGGLDRAHYFKGVGYLIEAMSRLRETDYRWRLVVVGSGELTSAYRDLAAQLNIDRKTIFTGYIPGELLPQYYHLADVAVLPSVDASEAFGLTLVEAMACARPVVATNLPGVRSVVSDGQNGLLVNPKDADDLASKIHYLLANPTVGQQFGQAGRRKVEQQYDWRIIGKQLDELYRTL